jgi:hypothetical protein
MRRIAFLLIGFLAVAGVIGYAVTSDVGGDDEGGARGIGGGTAVGPALGRAEAAPVSDEAMAVGEGAVGSSGSVAQLAALPDIGTSIIRTGSIAIRVERGEFARAFDAASLVAARYGGYVQSSSTSGTKVHSGDLLLRVPADRFDQALSDLRALGTRESESVSSEDVSGQLVDLEARLRTWQAQEAVLLDLMSRATTIEATIRVQSELQDVQVRIEEIKGRLNLLQDRTDLATIQVSLHEPGTAIVPQETESTRPSLAEAWQHALDGLLGVCYAVVVGLGYLVPISVIAALAWFAYRRARAARPSVTAS